LYAFNVHLLDRDLATAGPTERDVSPTLQLIEN